MKYMNLEKIFNCHLETYWTPNGDGKLEKERQQFYTCFVSSNGNISFSLWLKKSRKILHFVEILSDVLNTSIIF